MQKVIKFRGRRYRLDVERLRRAVGGTLVLAALAAEAVWFVGWCRMWWFV